jgi:hypothetical protein
MKIFTRRKDESTKNANPKISVGSSTILPFQKPKKPAVIIKIDIPKTGISTSSLVKITSVKGIRLSGFNRLIGCSMFFSD